MPGPLLASGSPSLLFWTDPDTGQIESVDFDVVTAETHENTLTLTRHPVESGAKMTDHAVEEPGLCTLEGFVGDASNALIDKDVAVTKVDASMPTMVFSAGSTQQIPLDIPTAPLSLSPGQLAQAGLKALASAISGQTKGTFRGKMRAAAATISASMLTQNAERDRVRDVYEKLLGAQQKRALITVQAGLREHYDMILTRLPARRDDDTGMGAAFDIDLEHIVVADSATVTAPEPAEKRGQKGKAGGSKHVGEDPNSEAKGEEVESTLSSMTP